MSSASSSRNAEKRICSQAVPWSEATLPASVEMSYCGAAAALPALPASRIVVATARTAPMVSATRVRGYRMNSPSLPDVHAARRPSCRARPTLTEPDESWRRAGKALWTGVTCRPYAAVAMASGSSVCWQPRSAQLPWACTRAPRHRQGRSPTHPPSTRRSRAASVASTSSTSVRAPPSRRSTASGSREGST